MDTISTGVTIDEVNAGEYKVQIGAGSTSATIDFANLFAINTNITLTTVLKIPAAVANE